MYFFFCHSIAKHYQKKDVILCLGTDRSMEGDRAYRKLHANLKSHHRLITVRHEEGRSPDIINFSPHCSGISGFTCTPNTMAHHLLGVMFEMKSTSVIFLSLPRKTQRHFFGCFYLFICLFFLPLSQ